MPHNCKVYSEDAHGEHGCDKDFSRQHMTGGTFPERHCSGSREQPKGPRKDMSNQYGRIGHGLFLEIMYADPSLNVPPNAMLERMYRGPRPNVPAYGVVEGITPESSANLTLPG